MSKITAKNDSTQTISQLLLGDEKNKSKGKEINEGCFLEKKESTSLTDSAIFRKKRAIRFLQLKLAEIKKIPTQRAKLFAKKGIITIEDLLETMPLRYEDWRIKEDDFSTPISLQTDRSYSFLVEILESEEPKFTQKGPLLNFKARVISGGPNFFLDTVIKLTFFNQLYLRKQLLKGVFLQVYGKLKEDYRGTFSLVMPKFKKVEASFLAENLKMNFNSLAEISFNRAKNEDKNKDEIETHQVTAGFTTIRPIYKTTSGLSQNIWQQTIKLIFDALVKELEKGQLSVEDFENLPLSFINRYPLPVYYSRLALWSIVHQYNSLGLDKFIDINKEEKTFTEILEEARIHLALRELFFFKLALGFSEKKQELLAYHQFKWTHNEIEETKKCLANLPFRLTRTQEDILGQIMENFLTQKAMNRLIQGDVGSGKTVVAGLACLPWLVQGKQALVMAPTTVLANQLANNFTDFYHNLKNRVADRNLRVELLTSVGSQKKQDAIREGFNKGEIDVLIGTTSLLNKKINSKNLALVITDEQHRFGVAQRQKLGEQLEVQEGRRLHTLAMTATPIPRSLALVLYGNMDLSELKEKPANLPKKQTYTITNKDLPRVFKMMKEELEKDNYIYLICPRKEVKDEDEISKHQADNLFDVYEVYEMLKEDCTIFSYGVGILHGSLKAEEKEEIMQNFLSGKIKILISTTVVEVGVNQPRANFMVIFNANHFGLASLHQLRGRIGRGSFHHEKDQRILCLLHSTKRLTGISKERLKAICDSDDGFYLAKKDLELRGPGDFFGLSQHGLPPLKIANLYTDMHLLIKLNDCLMDYELKVCNVLEREIIEHQLQRQFGSFYDQQII